MFVGGLCGALVGLRPQSSVGVVREQVTASYYLVDWDDNEEASREDWCRSCLRPLDDPKGMSLDELAKDIGWKIPAKETA